MEPFFFLLMVLVVVGVAAFGQAQQGGKERLFTELAGALGLTYVPGGRFGTPVLRGVHDGVAVCVELGTRTENKKQKPYTRFVADGVPADLRFEGEGFGILKILTGADHHTGDDTFDPMVLARGETALLQALLDADTRAALRHAVVVDNVVVADGRISLERKGHVTDVGAVRLVLDQVAGLARRLAYPGPAGLVDKLTRNVRSDPEPLVRLVCLAALESDHSGPAAAAAAQLALSDDDARVSLLGARIVGDSARFRAASDEALRAYAPHDPDGVARMLTKLGDPARLLALLDAPDPAVQVSALHGLARIGTPDHVVAILPLSKGIFGDDAVKAAARACVESIQARVGSGAAGRVTLAEESGGEVSIAAGAGRVSLPAGTKG